MIDFSACAIPPPPHPTYDIHKVIKDALEEDAGDLGDITTLATVSESTQAEAILLAKAEGVLAGVAVAAAVFETVDPGLKLAWAAADGDRVTPGQVLGRVHGSARSILVAERVALNFMQRMSGIATATACMVASMRGTKAKLLETRKTAPCLRLVDKWAVAIGGGTNHRIGLFDMILIKDNHIAAAGGLAEAVRRAEQYITQNSLSVEVDVEVRTLSEVDQLAAVLDTGSAPHVTRALLDNMARRMPPGVNAGGAGATTGVASNATTGVQGSTTGDGGAASGPVSTTTGGVDVGTSTAVEEAAAAAGGVIVDVSMLEEAVRRLAGRVATEASGNVTQGTVAAIAATGVDYVSCGALTHSVTALDISLDITTS